MRKLLIPLVAAAVLAVGFTGGSALALGKGPAAPASAPYCTEDIPSSSCSLPIGVYPDGTFILCVSSTSPYEVLSHPGRKSANCQPGFKRVFLQTIPDVTTAPTVTKSPEPVPTTLPPTTPPVASPTGNARKK